VASNHSHMIRFPASALVDVAGELLVRAGMRHDAAATTAELLVEADMMGHDTHGLQLLPGYLRALADGSLAGSGEPTALFGTEVVSVWDGHYLPGLWLTSQALDWAASRAGSAGIGVVTIRRSGHIGCHCEDSLELRKSEHEE